MCSRVSELETRSLLPLRCSPCIPPRSVGIFSTVLAYVRSCRDPLMRHIPLIPMPLRTPCAELANPVDVIDARTDVSADSVDCAARHDESLQSAPTHLLRIALSPASRFGARCRVRRYSTACIWRATRQTESHYLRSEVRLLRYAGLGRRFEFGRSCHSPRNVLAPSS